MRTEPIEDICCSAYHGTTEQCANNIIRNGFILPKDPRHNRFGMAVYFWENSPEEARRWAEKNNNGDSISIIKSKIRLGAHINTATPEGIRIIKRVHNELSKYLKTNPLLIANYNVRSITDIEVLNFMAKKGWIQTAKIIHYPDTDPAEVFHGSKIYSGLKIMICVYCLENILEKQIYQPNI